MDFANYWFSSAAGGGGYEVGNSLRFRGVSGQYLRRNANTGTAATSGTISVWLKKAVVSTAPSYAQTLFAGEGSGYLTLIDFPGSDQTSSSQLEIYTQAGGRRNCNAGFRDPSAWYHVVITMSNVNTSNVTVTIYINGVQDSQVTGNQYAKFWGDGTAIPLTIGNYGSAGAGSAFNGYMAEFHSVQNQTLGPTNFGEFNTDGVWVPKNVSGITYGSNGFYLDFSDPSNIGADRSGNGNNFTPTGFQLTTTTSTSYDWVADSPTNNYCTFNPLDRRAVVSGTALESSNLTAQNSSTTAYGGWYSTQTIDPANDSFAEANLQWGGTTYTWQFYLRTVNGSQAFRLYNENSGATIQYNGSTQTTTSRFNNGDEFGMRCTNGTVRFYRNGSQIYQFSQTLTSPAQTFILTSWNNREHWTWGQRPYINSNPTSGTGEEHWSTANMPDVDVTDPSDHFQTVLDTGANIRGTAQSTFTNGLWWIKDRANSNQHQLIDSQRGLTSSITTPGNSGNTSYTTPSGNSVAWCWATPGSSATNNNGTIQSTVDVNTTAGFSIVTYTGNGTSGATVGHGLSQAPDLILPKVLSRNGDSWHSYHSTLGGTRGIVLNSSNAAATDSGYWNNTNPTNTVFTVGTYNTFSSQQYVAYCWHSVPGYSSFGSYVGNGNSDGPFIYTGFRPAFVIIKNTSVVANWVVWDTARNPYNVSTTRLFPNLADAEATGTGANDLDILSNGFKPRAIHQEVNRSGENFIYMAFAEHPFGGGNVSPSPAR